jgi:hypothetical protein
LNVSAAPVSAPAPDDQTGKRAASATPAIAVSDAAAAAGVVLKGPEKL